MNFSFIFIKETTEVLKRGENSYWAPPGSLNTDDRVERKRSLEGRCLSLLEYLPEICLETRAKRLGMQKTKAESQAQDSDPRLSPESLHSPAICGDGACLSELGLLLVGRF